MLLKTMLNSPGAATLADLGGRFLFPSSENINDKYYNFAFDFINWVTVFFFVLIIVVMVWFAWKYRRRGDAEHATDTASHNTGLEMAWTLPPLVIVMYMFYLGISGYMKITTPPANTYNIEVTARQWSWQFTQPNGYTSDVLDVPAGKPVLLHMASNDVIHSLFIPVFRIKKDVVPGRYSTLWFQAKHPTEYADAPLMTGKELDDYVTQKVRGEVEQERAAKKSGASGGASAAESGGADTLPIDEEVAKRLKEMKPAKKQQYAVDRQREIAAEHGFQIYCAEFCGTGHSLMLSKVVVHKEDWHAPKPVKGTPWEEGRKTFLRNCNACHHLDPSTKPSPAQQCPDFSHGILGQQRAFVDGSTGTVTEDYIHESIVDPQAKVRSGPWVQGGRSIMPLLPLSPDQVNELVTFLKSPQKEPQ